MDKAKFDEKLTVVKGYFERHKTQLQLVMFIMFSIVAFVAQLVSRLLIDLAAKNSLTQTVHIWPFEPQALSSFLAFLFSNILAKIISFVMNRKKTFDANNNRLFSIIAYVVMVVVLIIVETIIGVPLGNALYKLFGGTFTGAELTNLTALNEKLYQGCQTVSMILYSTGDFVIVFLMDKFVIMRHKETAVVDENAEETPEVQA